tara:strand:- start:426 stop:710 length:285 start_codon:yes stop_codon:yes gene_type:complete
MTSIIGLVSKMALGHLENNSSNVTQLESTAGQQINYQQESAFSASPIALTVTMLSLTAIVITTFAGAVIYKRRTENRRERAVLAVNDQFELQEL